MKAKSKLHRVGRCLSQLLNVLLCNGNEDETLSSTIGKAKVANGGRLPKPKNSASWWRYWVHAILIRVPWIRGHFIKAIEVEEGRPIASYKSGDRHVP